MEFYDPLASEEIPRSAAQDHAVDKFVNPTPEHFGYKHTIMSTTRIAILQRELPRERRFVKDS